MQEKSACEMLEKREVREKERGVQFCESLRIKHNQYPPWGLQSCTHDCLSKHRVLEHSNNNLISVMLDGTSQKGIVGRWHSKPTITGGSRGKMCGDVVRSYRSWLWSHGRKITPRWQGARGQGFYVRQDDRSGKEKAAQT